MEFLMIAFLAAVQGVAEFLPVSSSGHLAVLGKLFGFDPESNLKLGIVLHAGTLCSIFVVYFPRLLAFLKPPYRWRAAAMVIVGSIPAGLAGIALKLSGIASGIFENFWVIGCGFLTTGIILWIGRRAAASVADGTTVDRTRWYTPIVVGIVQMLAIIPGISRSGSTIGAGLKCKLRADAAAEYSFLLAIPAIGGAGLVELLKSTEPIQKGELSMLIAGFFISAAVGIAALKILIVLLEKARFHYFAWYLWTIGTIVLLMALMGY
ncbi:MAG: undecaprenyl-diphosphate phosphatase [Victivallaceae bacterium]|nr:undecaprenyl-diphosphate phosphatase [Victivallaceae bacterium]